MTRIVTMVEVHHAAFQVGNAIINKLGTTTPFLYGVPRGGIPAALAIAAAFPSMTVVDDLQAAQVIVDDLVDSGATRKTFAPTGKPFASLFSKHYRDDAPQHDYLWGTQLHPKDWAVFPWEASEASSADDIVTRFLQFIGEDPTRGGLKETPQRVVKAWRDEWFSGYKKEPRAVLKVFEDGGEKYDEMVVVKGIPIYTHCEHHLAPFFGEAVVAYIPNGSIVGLSKLARLADVFARRLQVQERLTAQIADAIMEHLGARGAGVILRCRHLCMESRGIQKPGTETITSVMRGLMLEQPTARTELLALAR